MTISNDDKPTSTTTDVEPVKGIRRTQSKKVRGDTPSKTKKYFKSATDLGNHWVKAHVEGFEYIRFPSYYAKCVEATSNKIEGHVKYLRGDREDLIDQCWVIGEQATRTESVHCIRLVEEYNGKSSLYLEYFLGILAHLPQINDNQVHEITVTCNDVARHESEIIKNASGTHHVELRGIRSTVEIKIKAVYPEGVAALKFNQKSTGNVTVCDIGGGNVTLSKFSNCELVNTPTPEDFGVDWLLSELSKSSKLKKLLNQPPSIEILTKSIETGIKTIKNDEKKPVKVLYYGESKTDIRPIYEEELNRFIDCKLRPVLRKLVQAKESGETVLIIGGGAKLPQLETAMRDKGFIVSKSGEWDNLKGLVEGEKNAR